MPDAERLRWLELLSYIMALVSHARDPSEWLELQKTIESSVRTDIHRQEIFEMRRTIAENSVHSPLRGVFPHLLLEPHT
jgi:hypothetical protein